jgi:hypothetical protein
MVKMFLAIILGFALYLSLSFYQPVVEAQTIKNAEAQGNQQFSFISPIPYNLVVINK